MDMNILFSPPITFLIYLPLVIAMFLIGKALVGKENPTPEKASLYHSGEEAPTSTASPGYRPFFIIAFFFAVVHLGILVIGSGSFELPLLPYLIGLGLALIALILG
jgi:NADH:ubiquinone oxidoreductase subunit 3 (subunit A)